MPENVERLIASSPTGVHAAVANAIDGLPAKLEELKGKPLVGMLFFALDLNGDMSYQVSGDPESVMAGVADLIVRMGRLVPDSYPDNMGNS